jgi:hypothetical protein
MSRRQSRQLDRALTEFIEDVVVNITKTVELELEDKTPKLTTFASKNWVPQVGSSFEGLSGVRSLTSPINTSLRDAGRESLNGYRLSRGNVYITNNVPYISLLNAGSSAQAPANFVQKAIAAGIATAINRYR